MHYKDTSQQAFLIIYFICILFYVSLGRSRWVYHLKSRSTHKKKCGHPWFRLIADSEDNRLKAGAFTLRFETLPPSSCLSHLNLLVSHLSSRDKWNLICDVEVSAGQCSLVPLLQAFIPHPPAPVIYSLFVHVSAERQRDRPTNKSLVCTKIVYILLVLSRVLNLLTEKCQ